MQTDLDNKSKLILQRYTDNPRIPASHLSAELKLSKNAILERIKVLKEKKIILGSTCFLNYFKLGFSQYILFIKSSAFFAKPELINQIETESVVEILSIFGKYNLYIKFISKSDEQKHTFIEQAVEQLCAEDYELVEITHYDLVPAKKHKKELKILPKNWQPSHHKEEFFEADQLDLRILEELTKDAQQSLALLANKLEESPQLIAYRYKRLLKEHILLRTYGYTDVFNKDLQLYFLRFELTKRSKSLLLFKEIMKDPNIQDISLLNHKQNFFCILEAKTRKDMLRSMQHILSLSPHIRSIDIDIYSSQPYYNFFPRIIYSECKQ